MDDKKMEIDQSIVKIEGIKREQNSSSENQDVIFVEVPSIEPHSDTMTTPVRRKIYKTRKSRKVPTNKKRTYCSVLTAKTADHFRPIWPKPSQLSPPFINMPTLPPNQIIVRNIAPSNVSEKNNCMKPNSSKNINNSDISSVNIVSNIFSNINNSNNDSNIENLPSIKKKEETDKTEVNIARSCTNISNNNYSNCSNSSEDLGIIKVTPKFHKSTKLFFESMAQTVSYLPKEVQADIKMQICEIVSKAEIQYYELQTKVKTEN